MSLWKVLNSQISGGVLISNGRRIRLEGRTLHQVITNSKMFENNDVGLNMTIEMTNNKSDGVERTSNSRQSVLPTGLDPDFIRFGQQVTII